MTFGTSAYLDWRYQLAPSEKAFSLIKPLVAMLGGTDEDSHRFSQKSYRNGHLEQLEVWVRRVESVTATNSTANHAKKFWAAQALAYPVFSQEPVAKEPLDEAAVRMLQVGAESFFEAGLPQFQKLKAVCQDVVNWFVHNPEKRMAILESPLGNCVPVAVLNTLAQRAGLSPALILWNAPRNDRPLAGNTVADSANEISIRVDTEAILVFIDDAITGTRFIKCYDALRKVLKGRILPIAMIFKDMSVPTTTANQLERLRKRTSKAASETGYYDTFVEVPTLADFRIDVGMPVRWETPVIWGETDLVAGKRKVNLLFNLLEHLNAVLEDLSANGNFVRYLEKAWRRNTEGAQFEFPPGLTGTTIKHLTSNLKLDEVVRKLVESGRQKFPDDFTGDIMSISNDEVKERWEWLRTSFLELANSKLKREEAYLLWRAFDETFAASNPQIKVRPSRDHAYATYALRYNETLHSFHERLVLLISNIPE